MAEEKLVFKEGITNLLDSVRARLGPKMRERLRMEAGVDESKLVPAYSLASHDTVIKILAEELYPGTPMDVATYEVGRALMSNYGKGVLGRALFSIIRMIGPLRMLKRMPEYFRQTNNYADVKIQATGPASYELEHNEVGAWPHFMRGSLQGSGEVIGVPGHGVELLSYDGHVGRFRVYWKE